MQSAEPELAIGDPPIPKRETEAAAPAAEVEDFGDECVLMHLNGKRISKSSYCDGSWCVYVDVAKRTREKVEGGVNTL